MYPVSQVGALLSTAMLELYIEIFTKCYLIIVLHPRNVYYFLSTFFKFFFGTNLMHVLFSLLLSLLLLLL